MGNNGIAKYIALSTLGLIIMIVGFVLAKLLQDGQGIMLTFPYICIGIGAGIFGRNLGTTIKKNLLKKNPRIAKEFEIEAKDERNIVINYRAKAKAYDLMLVVFSALILIFALMQVDMYVILALVVAYLFVVFSMVYYLNKYHKEM